MHLVQKQCVLELYGYYRTVIRNLKLEVEPTVQRGMATRADQNAPLRKNLHRQYLENQTR